MLELYRHPCVQTALFRTRINTWDSKWPLFPRFLWLPDFSLGLLRKSFLFLSWCMCQIDFGNDVLALKVFLINRNILYFKNNTSDWTGKQEERHTDTTSATLLLKCTPHLEGQGQARLQSGTRNSTQVSCMGSSDSTTGAISSHLPG